MAGQEEGSKEIREKNQRNESSEKRITKKRIRVMRRRRR